MRYFIEENVIQNTEWVLKDYGLMNPSHEGFLYWGGTITKDKTVIDTVIAPDCNSASLRISTDHRANADVVINLVKRQRVHVAQVHSHPSDWVDHSDGDNEWASFKIKGLLSIVVPHYGLKGILPFNACGIHYYNGQKFIRLTKRQIRKKFKTINNKNAIYIDLRNA